MSERKQHWEEVYGTKSPLEVSWYQQEPTVSLRLIRDAGVGAEAAIIDVGGGASRLVDHLLSAGFQRPAVLDISGRALAHARERLGERAAGVEWVEADVTAFRPARAYDLWHDRAVFHFLTDPADRRRYREALLAGLAPGGHLIIGAFAIGGPTMCSGLEIVQYDAGKLSAELGPQFTLVEESGELHITPAAKEQHFGWFRFRRAE